MSEKIIKNGRESECARLPSGFSHIRFQSEEKLACSFISNMPLVLQHISSAIDNIDSLIDCAENLF